MKNLLYSLVIMFGLCLPVAAFAQADQTASTRQLPAEALTLLEPAAASMLAPVTAERSTRVYTGTVLNEKGLPLAGALVACGPERSQIAVTNADGAYVLRSKAPVPHLHVSYAGYEEAELSVATPMPITVTLTPVDNYKRLLKKQNKEAVKAFYNK